MQKEIDRYITWPGQALAYKMGQLRFVEMRETARKALGEDFNIREFHDVILRSMGPMDMVEKEVSKWIDNKRSAELA